MVFEKLLGLLETSYWRVLLTALVVVVLALIVHRAGAALIWRLTRNLPVSSAVARRCWRPSRLVLPVFTLQAVWQVAADTLPLIAQIRHGNARLLARTVSFMVVMAGLSGLTTACRWSRCAKRLDAPAKPPSSGTSGCVCCR